MRAPRYAVLRGRPEAVTLDDDLSPHIEIKVEARGWHRVAVNARSLAPPHDLLFARIEPLSGRFTSLLPQLPKGLTMLGPGHRTLGLDYVRGGFVRRAAMRVLPFRQPGARNDLREFVGLALAEAMRDEDAQLYAFGEPWGPEEGRPDDYFGFEPGRGIHDVHMNQGSKHPFRGANRPRQDGALIFHFPAERRWVGLFLAFQSQSWRTDPRTGHPLRRR